MVILAVEETEGREWWGVSADGYVTEPSLLRAHYVREFPEQQAIAAATPPIQLLGDLAEAVFPQCYRRTFCESLDVDRASLLHVHYNPDRPILPPYTWLHQEYLQDPNREACTQIIMLRAGGLRTDACLRSLVQALGLAIKPQHAYADFQRFRSDCEDLVERLLRIFSCPRATAHDELSRLGFGAELY